jgi:hypothetical protein
VKNTKKKSKIPIKFDNLYTLQPDNLKPRPQTTFFGVQLPEEEPDEEDDKPEENVPEQTDEGDDFDQAKFFVTEAQHAKARKNTQEPEFKDGNIGENEEEGFEGGEEEEEKYGEREREREME